MTVPNKPMNGVVDATTDKNINPLVASLVEAYDAKSKRFRQKRSL